MPSRILREGILSSDRVNSLSVAAEVFYRRLMSVVDDFGRFDGRPSLLRVSCYPLRVDAVREADLSRWIAECVKAGLLVLYAVDGKHYLEIQDFKQQTRAKSKYPPPSSGQVLSVCDADAEQTQCECLADATQTQTPVHLFRSRISESESDLLEQSSESLPASEPTSGFALLLNDGSEYAVATRTLREWAQSFPAVDVEQELRSMRAWCEANPKKRKTRRGVSAFIVRWLQGAQDKPSRSGKPVLRNGDVDDWTVNAI